jgi:SH3-like domain-containing protein
MNRFSIGMVLGAVALVGCEKKSASEAAAVATSPQVVAPAVPTEQLAYVIFGAVAKKAPNELPKVDEKGKQVANWVATLARGERVTLLKEEADYQQVRTSGDVTGWVKKAALLPENKASPATVLDASEGFDRPELFTINSKKKVEAGTLLFVLRTKGEFSEVNVNGWASAWVRSSAVNTDASEIGVSKMLARARELKTANNLSGAEDLLKVAKKTYGSARLLPTFERALE